MKKAEIQNRKFKMSNPVSRIQNTEYKISIFNAQCSIFNSYIRSRTPNATRKTVLFSIPSPRSTSLRCGLSILNTPIKAILITLFAALTAAPSLAQTCISWQTILGEEGIDERATDIHYNQADESFWVCGYQTSPFQTGAGNSKNAWLLQTNLQGELIQDFVIKDSTELVANALVQNATGIFLGGYYHPINLVNDKKAWLAYYNMDTVNWMIKKNEHSEIKDIIQLNNGDLLTTGYVNVTDTSQMKLLIEKYKPNGTIEWSKTYGGSKDDEGNALSLLDDQTILVAGFTSSSDGNISNHLGGRDVWLLAVDVETGMLLKEKTFGGTSNDVAVDLVVLPNKQIAFLSESLSSNGDISNSIGNGDFWLAMLNQNWEIIWEQSYGGLDSDFPQSLEVFPEGDLLISGTSFSSNGDIKTNYGFLDSWVAKIDQTDGSIIWNKVIGGDDLDQVASMAIYDDTKIALAGNTDSYDIQCKTKHNQHANQNVWLFGLDEMLLNTNELIVEYDSFFHYYIQDAYLHLQNNSIYSADILIVDINGRTFYQSKLAPTSQQNINFTNWQKGLYTLIYKNEFEVLEIKKLALY